MHVHAHRETRCRCSVVDTCHRERDSVGGPFLSLYKHTDTHRETHKVVYVKIQNNEGMRFELRVFEPNLNLKTKNKKQLKI